MIKNTCTGVVKIHCANSFAVKPPTFVLETILHSRQIAEDHGKEEDRDREQQRPQHLGSKQKIRVASREVESEMQHWPKQQAFARKGAAADMYMAAYFM